jgi:hypothetical protein
MTEYQEGQEVEIWGANMHPWRPARIIRNRAKSGHAANGYEVQFLDGSRGVYGAEHIRETKVKCLICGAGNGTHYWNCTLNIGASK